MAECGAEVCMQICPDCGHIHISRANLCRDRLCPTCAWRLSLKRFADMFKVMSIIAEDYPSMRYVLCTLTVRSCPLRDLHATLRQMAQSWNRVMARKPIQRNIAGWARATEVTYNAQRKLWHPHYHVILCIDGSLDNDIIQTAKGLIDAWMESCNLITNIAAQDAREIYDKSDEPICATAEDVQNRRPDLIRAVCETMKYATKHKSLLDLPPAVLATYASQMDGVRVVGYGGLVSKIRKMLKLEDELPKDRDTSEQLCVECGSARLTNMIYRWSSGANEYVPFE